MQVALDMVGRNVKLAGWPSRRADNELLVAFALRGFLAQCGCCEQALNLRRRQPPPLLALSASGELVL